MSVRVSDLWFVPLLLSTALVAQGRVWVVDARGGAGSHFTDLPAAVAAASPGDVLRVRAGTYRPIVVGKALSIFGEQGAVIAVPAFGSQAIIVENLAGVDEASIRGFGFVRDPLALSSPLLEVRQCQGSVLLEAVTAIKGLTIGVPDDPVVRIANSRLVAITASTIVGVPAVAATASTLVLTASTCTAPDHSGNPFQVTGPAIRATDSTVFVARGEHQGGSTNEGRGGAAVESVRSHWIVNGSAILRAGSERGGAIPAIAGDGTVKLHPRASLLPSGGAPPVAPGLAVTPAAIPSLRATGNRIGGVVHLNLAAEPNDVAAMVLGFLGTAIDLGMGAPLFLDPGRPMITLPPGIVGATGSLAVSFTAPNDPNLVGLRCSWQAVTVSSALVAWLSTPDAYVH